VALAFRPHSATYKAPSAVTDTIGGVSGVVVGVDHPTTTATILGQLDEVTSRETFERFGIEEDRGGIWMCNSADGDGIELNGELQIDGSSWMVKAKKHITHGLGLDHWEILVARVYA
jgi:hypothetical protein